MSNCLSPAICSCISIPSVTPERRLGDRLCLAIRRSVTKETIRTKVAFHLHISLHILNVQYNPPLSSPEMSYTDLPTEILNLIATHLDITSAISLAQTSSFSRQAAESRIWRSLTIDHVNRFQPIDDGVKVDQYLSYITLIHLQPWRSTLIRSLMVEPQFTPSPNLSVLLKLISGGLKYLRIMYPTGLLVPTKPLKMIPKMIEDVAMPALREIEVDIATWECLGPLLEHSRGLKRLTMRGSESLGGVTAAAMGMGVIRSDPLATSPIEILEIDIPEVIQLEYLFIDRMDPTIISLLAKVVDHSPKLNTVILRDPQVRWLPYSTSTSDDASASPQDDPLLLALSRNMSITSLDIHSTCLKLMESIISHSGGFGNVEDLTIVWEFPQLYACSGGKQSIGNSQSDVLIPPFTNLTGCIFTLRTHHCDPNAPPYSIYRGYIFDLSIKAIKRHALLTQFDSTPLLESIQLRDMYGSKSTGSHPRCETEFDGAFITRYLGNEGELLIVLRHRVAHSCGWEEYGVYERREIPKSVLGGVMRVNGSDAGKRDPVQPGWGELHDETWDVLRHWATLL
jgi:hypothetical protein